MSYKALVVTLLEPLDTTAEHRFAALQNIRHSYDAAYTRWLPHITLIPPFIIKPPASKEHSSSASSSPAVSTDLPAWLSQTLQDLSQRLVDVCKRHSAHNLRLCEVHSFRLRVYTNMHLRPDKITAEPLLALQHDLSKTAAPILPSKRARQGFIPHASLGQAFSPEDRADLETEARQFLACSRPSDAFVPVEDSGLLVRINKIQVMYKHGQQKGPYKIWRELQLGH